jgi:hypothetical protein
MSEPNEEARVKQRYPDAQCQWTSRGWRVLGHIDGSLAELGRTSSAHVPELEAWADASRKMGNEFVDDIGPIEAGSDSPKVPDDHKQLMIPEDLQQDYGLVVAALLDPRGPETYPDNRRVLGKLREYIERIASLEANNARIIEERRLMLNKVAGLEAERDFFASQVNVNQDGVNVVSAILRERDEARADNKRLHEENEVWKHAIGLKDKELLEYADEVQKRGETIACLKQPVSDDRLKWLADHEAGLITHRQKKADGGWWIWWNVVKRGRSISGHPLGSPQAAIDTAILAARSTGKGDQ